MKKLVIVLCVLIVGCKTHEDVEFIGLKNTQVSGTEGTMIIVNADAVLFNPNEVKGKLRSIDVVVFHEDKEVARVNHVSKTKVLGNSEFIVPLVLKVDMNKLNSDFLSKITSIFSKKGIDLQFVGNVRVSIHGIGYKVPVNHTERITF